MTHYLKCVAIMSLCCYGLSSPCGETMAATGLDEALIGYWKLAGDCEDHSGNNNQGINHDTVFEETDRGMAARFDGKKSFIEIPSGDALNTGTGEFTISAWIRCGANSGHFVGDIVGKFDPDTRRGINFNVSASSPGYSSASDARNLHFGIDNAVESEWADCGRPWHENTLISTLIVYKGQLYTGIADALNPQNACHMYRYVDGQTWEDCGRVGSNLTTVSIMSVCVHEGDLYAGTGTWNYLNLGPYGHPSVYRYQGGAEWHDCGLSTPGKRITSLASCNGALYAADDTGYTYRYESDNGWVSCGRVPAYKLLSMMVYQDQLYGGASTHIHRYAGGTSWDTVASFNEEEICQVHCFGVYGGELYAGTWERGRIMRYDGDDNWVACGDTGALNDTVSRGGRASHNNEINDLRVYNGKMYAGVIPKGEVWRYDGGRKTTLLKRLVTNPGYSSESHLSWRRVPCMTEFQGKLFCGTSTANGAADASVEDESGKVFSWEAGKSVSYDDDLGTDWKYVTAVRKEKCLKLYVDGQLVATSPEFVQATYDLSNDKPLLIGFGSLNYFNGWMSELRIHGRALEDAEILQLFQN